MSAELDKLLRRLGYKLAEDAWETQGRRSYVASEDADQVFLNDLGSDLRSLGWLRHKSLLRAFQKSDGSELLEIEPGGPDTGHFLHRLKLPIE